MKTYIKHYICLLLFVIFSNGILHAQEVPVSTESGVYIFLDQMSLQYVFIVNLSSAFLASTIAILSGWSGITSLFAKTKSCVKEIYHFGNFKLSQ